MHNMYSNQICNWCQKERMQNLPGHGNDFYALPMTNFAKDGNKVKKWYYVALAMYSKLCELFRRT